MPKTRPINTSLSEADETMTQLLSPLRTRDDNDDHNEHLPRPLPPPLPPPPLSPTSGSNRGSAASPRISSSNAKRRQLEGSSKNGLSDEEIDLVLQNLAEERMSLMGAGMGKQTWSRYIVENYLADVSNVVELEARVFDGSGKLGRCRRRSFVFLLCLMLKKNQSIFYYLFHFLILSDCSLFSK